MMKRYPWLLTACFIFSGNVVSGSVFAATANNFNAKVCTASYTSISNIVISESGAVADFGLVGTATSNNLLFINAPAGFSFNPGTGSVSHSGGGNIVTAVVLFVNASTIAISYSVDNNTILKNDVMTISGIRVKADSVSATTASATIGSGSTAIVGIPAGTTVATFQSALITISFFPPTTSYTSDASFSLGGYSSRTLAGGVSLNSTSFSGTGVTSPSFNPAIAGAGIHTLTHTVNTIGPTCSFAITAVIDVNLPPADADNDGLSNATEITLGSNPDLADSDGDGLSDGLEVIQYVTNPLSDDTDGDGINDAIDPEPGTEACTMPLDGTYKGMNLSGGGGS